MTDLQNIDNINILRKGFIDTLTHDFKTPVIAQIRILELLLNNKFGSLESEQISIINEMLESSKYLYEMISNLISTYRFENENFKLHYSYFDFLQTVEFCLKNIDKFLKNYNIKVVIIPEISNKFILGDKIMLQKVIQSLLFNIINKSFKNSIVKIFVTENKNNLNFLIEFHGCYMTPDKINTFFDFHNSEYYDKLGAGIGLYMAKKIVEKHCGNVFVKSTRQQKNLIGFEIPIFNCESSELCVNFA